jgi:hypothetical protein
VTIEDISDILDVYRTFSPDVAGSTELASQLDLRGRRAVVTGGGGPGLGRACAHRLAAAGAALVLADVNGAAAEAVAAEVASAHGVRAIGIAPTPPTRTPRSG